MFALPPMNRCDVARSPFRAFLEVKEGLGTCPPPGILKGAAKSREVFSECGTGISVLDRNFSEKQKRAER